VLSVHPPQRVHEAAARVVGDDHERDEHGDDDGETEDEAGAHGVKR